MRWCRTTRTERHCVTVRTVKSPVVSNFVLLQFSELVLPLSKGVDSSKSEHIAGGRLQFGDIVLTLDSAVNFCEADGHRLLVVATSQVRRSERVNVRRARN